MDKQGEIDQHLLQLIWGLQSSAWISLGKQMNPITQETSVNMELAKDSIDTLIMLKEKMKGNLNNGESTFLENTLSNLQINYIDSNKKEEKNGSKEKESN